MVLRSTFLYNVSDMKQTDYLIVGTGIAGLATALHLSKKGEVTLLTKGLLKESNSYWAQGGIAAVLTEEDSFESHIEDTLEAGVHHNNVEAVELLVKKAPEAIHFLKELGVKFSDTPLMEGGHSKARVWQTSDFTGQDVMNQLIKSVQKNKAIHVLERSEAVELIVDDGTCRGIFVLESDQEEAYPLLANSTVLATGGIGQLYEKTSNTLAASGDGLALALKAGLKLKDLEFVQFHPTALDKEDNGRYFLLSETLRGYGAKVLNYEKKTFLDDYHPKGALAPRDLVTRGIYFELANGPVYLSLAHLDSKELKKTFPNIIKRLRQYEFDPFSDPIPITPVAHFSCGGISTNLKGETKIPHLYAVGEVACTGAHGANRLGSNALLEALVFAREISDNINEAHHSSSHFELKAPQLIKEDINQVKAYAKRISRIMWQYVAMIRDEEGLRTAYQEIEKIPARDYQIQWRQKVCLEIIAAALDRDESLGCHFRQGLIV